ncbi:hypothetical protein BC941DRAFT_423206 [Chlamydoabsidia padenii]|nr:hypothetical protein BC941DRAFT_423206 [Chlamydoabsidia padenii]
MANTQIKQASYKQQQLTYSPPQQTTEESHEPSIPLQVPTLTPPHSSNTTQHHKQQYGQPHSPTNSVENAYCIDLTKQTAPKQSPSTLLDTATLVYKPASQCLPPRKRIQPLKKQFTKPNLSSPVIPLSQPITMEAVEPTNTGVWTYQESPSSSTRTSTAIQVDSRSPSPLVDIEDNSGETTETDDDDWQQRKISSTSEPILMKDDDDDHLFTPTKHAIIINKQQQQSLPTPSPDSTSALKKPQKAKKPLKKSLDPSALQSPSRGPDRQEATLSSQTKEEKTQKTKKKKGRLPTKSSDELAPTKIRKTSSGRPSRSRTKKTGALYCICQTPYDVPRFMIACDRCDQWFHGECIGISEKEGEFIDLYFCDVCGKETGKSTSWKSKCGNPACTKPSRIGTHQGYYSKYCSHECGMQVARARLELTEMKRRQTDDTTDNSVPQLTIDKLRQSRLSSNAEKEDQHRLEQLKKMKLRALDVVQMIEHKQLFLELTGQQAQRSDCCGFDSRLVWDDPLWIKVQAVVTIGSRILLQYDGSPQEQQEQCQVLRKDCRQHQQWQKILDLEMKQERKEQLQVIKMLEKEKQEIKNRMRQRRNQVDLADSLGNGTISY